MSRSHRSGGSAATVALAIAIASGARAARAEEGGAPPPAQGQAQATATAPEPTPPAPVPAQAETAAADGPDRAPLADAQLPDGVEDGIAFTWKLIQLAAFLAGLSGLGYLATRVLGPRLGLLGGRPGDIVRVVERRPLDAKTTLYVIEVAGKHALIAVSDREVRALSQLEIDDERIREVLGARRDGGTTQRIAAPSFTQVLAESRGRRAGSGNGDGAPAAVGAAASGERGA